MAGNFAVWRDAMRDERTEGTKGLTLAYRGFHFMLDLVISPLPFPAQRFLAKAEDYVRTLCRTKRAPHHSLAECRQWWRDNPHLGW